MQYPKILLAAFVLFSFIACKKNENTISLPLISTLNIQYTDTVSIDLSTVLIDSFITSSNSQLLAGKFSDAAIGTINAKAFLQMSLQGKDSNLDKFEDILLAAESPVYDSISFLIKINYYYGDTLSDFKINTHQVIEPIVFRPNVNALYNKSSFKYDPVPLGSASFSRPPLNDTLRMPLDASFGNKLFNLAKRKDQSTMNTENFRQVFQGLALVASDGSNKAIFGFLSTPVIRMYFHDSLSVRKVLYYDFVHTTTDIHSNQIINDRSTVAGLNTLKEAYDEVSANQMNNTAVLLTGIEILPKIQFPFLNTLKSISNNTLLVNRAELIITPKSQSYNDQFYLPGDLVLRRTSNTNIPGSQINYTQSSNVQVISPVIDRENNSNTFYKFEITDFINQKLRTDDHTSALFLVPFNNNSATRTEKLILDQSNIKLILYLTVM